MSREWWNEDLEDIAQAELERQYREESGDKTWLCGYEARFMEWQAEKERADPNGPTLYLSGREVERRELVGRAGEVEGHRDTRTG